MSFERTRALGMRHLEALLLLFVFACTCAEPRPDGTVVLDPQPEPTTEVGTNGEKPGDSPSNFVFGEYQGGRDLPLAATVEFEILDPRYRSQYGPSPYVSLKDPADDIRYMQAPNVRVVNSPNLTIVIDYPVTSEWSVTVRSSSPRGFTRSELAQMVSDIYHRMYELEEQTSSIRVIPLDQRRGLSNRNTTNGKFGIWGHDIDDLVLHSLDVRRTTDGDLIAFLGIDS
jgi:hypothetical protein